jgi:uncharacterized protein YjbJ (UPF0337 family)
LGCALTDLGGDGGDNRHSDSFDVRTVKEAQMNKDQIKGRAEEVAGKSKVTVGKVFKDGELANKGRAEEVAGKARATYGDAKNEVKKDVNSKQ